MGETDWVFAKDLSEVSPRFRSVVEGAREDRVAEYVRRFPEIEGYAGLFAIVSTSRNSCYERPSHLPLLG